MPGGKPIAPKPFKPPKSKPGAPPKKLSVPRPCTAETAAASAGARLVESFGLEMPGGGNTGCGDKPGAGPVNNRPRSIPGGGRCILIGSISAGGAGLMAFALPAMFPGAGGGGMDGGGGSAMAVSSGGPA